MGKKRAILIVAILALAGGTLAAYLTRGSSEGQAESVRTVNSGSSDRLDATDSLVSEITATIYQMDRLSLDASIFNSAAFRVLQDNSQQIAPQEPGRDNPFAPLSDVSASTRRVATGGGLINANRTPTGGTSGAAPTLPVR